MFKIGINSAPRIVPAEVTETQESPVQQNLQQQSTPQAKPTSAVNTSIRAEAMFSAFAMRSQLTQQLAKNESMSINPASLKQIVSMDDQAPLTQSEAELQIESRPTLIKPFDADEVRKGVLLARTLHTGDGNDRVYIYKGDDGLVHVDVNDKEAWSGTEKQFSAWTINTGKGDDFVVNSISGAKIETGDGDDTVKNLEAFGVQIQTGDGNDSVIDEDGNRTEIDTGTGDDYVRLYGSYNGKVNSGNGNDSIQITGAVNSEVRTGTGFDRVTVNYSDNTRISTENRNDDSILIDRRSHDTEIDGKKIED